MQITGRLTAKSDVYSFGVVLLELLSGRRALDSTKVGVEQNLVEWAKPYLGDKRKVFRIMDTKLEGQYPQKGAHAIATLAVCCLHTDGKSRPKMSKVLEVLEQLENPKDGAQQSPPEPQVFQGHTMRSPLRQARSPMNRTPIASPLPSHGHTVQVY